MDSEFASYEDQTDRGMKLSSQVTRRLAQQPTRALAVVTLLKDWICERTFPAEKKIGKRTQLNRVTRDPLLHNRSSLSVQLVDNKKKKVINNEQAR